MRNLIAVLLASLLSSACTSSDAVDILTAGLNVAAATAGTSTSYSSPSAPSRISCPEGYYSASPGYGKEFICMPYGNGSGTVSRHRSSDITGL